MSNNLQKSWGLYPNSPQVSHPIFWQNELESCWSSLVKNSGTTLPFGNGRSYGDSCLATSCDVIHTKTLNRFIRADWQNGIIVAEAGVTLGEILRVSIPNGWFLSVTPGTQFATLGGAIANDVHGKNHHRRGTFGNHVVQFNLNRTGEGGVICSSTENKELFSATIGGLGLTGVVTSAEIKLIPIKSRQIVSTMVRFNNLSEFFSLSEELDSQHEYSVAWIDCLAKDEQSGRGVFIVGDHSDYGDLELSDLSKLAVPFTPPISLINPLTLKVFNDLYWRKHPKERTVLTSDFEPFFYPLDGINNWNRVYGKKGFQQYQCVIPENNAYDAMTELLATISDSGQGSFLAVMKRCGYIESPGLLSFPLPGISLALDFPMNDYLESHLFTKLDQIVSQAGGRLYPAKDAHMSAETFQSAYSNWELLESYRDPSLQSQFWKRVTS